MKFRKQILVLTEGRNASDRSTLESEKNKIKVIGLSDIFFTFASAFSRNNSMRIIEEKKVENFVGGVEFVSTFAARK